MTAMPIPHDPLIKRRVFAFWREGRDTQQIAWVLGLTEAAVYNLLARR